MMSRTVLFKSLIPASKSRPALRQWTRLQSTNVSVSRRNYVWSHLLAGVAGGGLVVGAGYTWYQFSGIKRAVDASKHVAEYLKQTKQSVLEKHPNEAIKYLRNLAKSYAAVLPGTGYFVDKVFDSLDDIVREHSAEASIILLKAQRELSAIMKRKGELSNTELSSEILFVIGTHMSEIASLGVKAGGQFVQPVRDRIPEKEYLVGKTNESVGMLKGIAENAWKKKWSKEDRNTDHKESRASDNEGTD